MFWYLVVFNEGTLFFFNNFIYLKFYNFGCAGSSLLP